VAMVVSLLLHMPPVAVSLKVIIEPTHRIDGPVMARTWLSHKTRIQDSRYSVLSILLRTMQIYWF
jgi:hypothetical protein